MKREMVTRGGRMRLRFQTFLIAMLAVTIAAIPAWGHHSTASVFDLSRIVSIRGIVAKVEWNNPHIHIYVDVRDDKGNVEQWTLETSTPNMMSGNGLNREMFRPGLPIAACGHGTRPVALIPPGAVPAGADAS